MDTRGVSRSRVLRRDLDDARQLVAHRRLGGRERDRGATGALFLTFAGRRRARPLDSPSNGVTTNVSASPRRMLPGLSAGVSGGQGHADSVLEPRVAVPDRVAVAVGGGRSIRALAPVSAVGSAGSMDTAARSGRVDRHEAGLAGRSLCWPSEGVTSTVQTSCFLIRPAGMALASAGRPAGLPLDRPRVAERDGVAVQVRGGPVDPHVYRLAAAGAALENEIAGAVGRVFFTVTLARAAGESASPSLATTSSW
jgi:hypothetical protein